MKLLMNTSFIANTVSKKWAGKPIIPTPSLQNTHTHTHTHTHLVLEERREKNHLKCSCFMIWQELLISLLKVIFFCSLVVTLSEVLEDCVNSRQVANCAVLFIFSLSLSPIWYFEKKCDSSIKWIQFFHLLHV